MVLPRSYFYNDEITTLTTALVKFNNDALSCAINNVQQHLYGKEALEGSWVGEDLLTAIQQINAAGIEENTSNKFTLNPN